jgi:hypothetical protein
MDVIVNLPPDVLRVVVVDWLYMEDVAHLDSAACHHTFRDELLRQLYANSNLYTQYRKEYSKVLRNWAAVRLPLMSQVHFLDEVIQRLPEADAFMSSYFQDLFVWNEVLHCSLGECLHSAAPSTVRTCAEVYNPQICCCCVGVSQCKKNSRCR